MLVLSVSPSSSAGPYACELQYNPNWNDLMCCDQSIINTFAELCPNFNDGGYQEYMVTLVINIYTEQDC